VTSAYLYAATRTPFGRYNGALPAVRPDDLAAATLTGLLSRTPHLDPVRIDDVVLENRSGGTP
jgi:acetyl-CoA acyltransferase